MYKLFLATSFAAATATPTLYTKDAHTQRYMFDTFVREYSKRYANADEEQTRFNNFVQNLKLADERNLAELKNNGTAVHGISRFMDLSQQEFEENLLGAKRSTQDKSDLKAVRTSVEASASTSVDWSGKLTTPVKDQVGGISF